MKQYNQDTARGSEELEALVDGFGLSTVLDMLRDICHEKADHIRTNWQDNELAASWDRDGRFIDRIVAKVGNS